MHIGPTLKFVVGLGGVCMVVACSGSEVDSQRATDPDSRVDVVTDVVVDTAGDTVQTDTTPRPDGSDAIADGQVDVTPDVQPDVVQPPLQWETLSLGDLGVLTDVHAVSPDVAYAVGASRVLRFNGATWAPYGDPQQNAELHGVWADENSIVVVGAAGFVAIRGADTLSWTASDSGVTVDLMSVDARDADDVWVAGADGTVLHWDGTDWNTEFTLNGIDLHSIWVDPESTGSDGVYAVGNGGQLVSNDGGGWRNEQIAVGDATLSGIFGVDGALFAVGTEATITALLPGAVGWQGQTTNDAQERDLMAVTGTAIDDVVAFGADGAVIRYDGTKWTVEPVTGPFNSVADIVAVDYVAEGDDTIWLAVAAEGDGLTRANDQWIDIFTKPEGGLRDIEGSTPDTLWAVGVAGLMMTTTAQGWTAVPLETDADLNALAIDASGTVWAVGDSGTIIRRTADGTLTMPDSQLPLDLFGVAAGDSDVSACGKGGTLLTISFDGASITPRATGAGADLQAVAVGGDGALWLSGNFGTLLRSVDGGTPTLVGSGVGGNLNDIVKTATGVLVAGDNGVVIEASATTTALLSERPGLFLYGVSSSTESFAVGWNGTVLRRVGDTFVTEETGVSAVLEAIWNQGGTAVAAGRQGTFLRRLETTP